MNYWNRYTEIGIVLFKSPFLLFLKVIWMWTTNALVTKMTIWKYSVIPAGRLRPTSICYKQLTLFFSYFGLLMCELCHWVLASIQVLFPLCIHNSFLNLQISLKLYIRFQVAKGVFQNCLTGKLWLVHLLRTATWL